MSYDSYTRFEEDNFEDLVDKFIEKYYKEWDEFVFDEFICREEDISNIPDRYEEE